MRCAQIGRVPRGLAHLWDRASGCRARRSALLRRPRRRRSGEHLLTDVVALRRGAAAAAPTSARGGGPWSRRRSASPRRERAGAALRLGVELLVALGHHRRGEAAPGRRPRTPRGRSRPAGRSAAVKLGLVVGEEPGDAVVDERGQAPRAHARRRACRRRAPRHRGAAGLLPADREQRARASRTSRSFSAPDRPDPAGAVAVEQRLHVLEEPGQVGVCARGCCGSASAAASAAAIGQPGHRPGQHQRAGRASRQARGAMSVPLSSQMRARTSTKSPWAAAGGARPRWTASGTEPSTWRAARSAPRASWRLGDAGEEHPAAPVEALVEVRRACQVPVQRLQHRRRPRHARRARRADDLEVVVDQVDVAARRAARPRRAACARARSRDHRCRARRACSNIGPVESGHTLVDLQRARARRSRADAHAAGRSSGMSVATTFSMPP